MRFLFKKSEPFIFLPSTGDFWSDFVSKCYEARSSSAAGFNYWLIHSVLFTIIYKLNGSEKRSIIYSFLKPREYTPIYHELSSPLPQSFLNIHFFVFRRLKSKRKRALIPLDDWPFKLKRRAETGSFYSSFSSLTTEILSEKKETRELRIKKYNSTSKNISDRGLQILIICLLNVKHLFVKKKTIDRSHFEI